jgi:AraC-like DNA-binding protein
MSAAVEMLTAGAEYTGDTDLGLHIAERAALNSFDVHFYAMASSATLGEAFERLCRYQRLTHETSRIDLTVTDSRATLRHSLPGGVAVPRQSAEFLLAAWVRAGRAITGVDWTPIEVRFGHMSPRDPVEHARIFRSAVLFSAGENSLALDRTLLDLPCLTPDATVPGLLDQFAGDRLARAPQAHGARGAREAMTADRVRHALALELSGGEPTAARIAARLRMSVRSLNRALAADGTAFRHILESIRAELASRHLADTRLSIAEVAFLLGFAELSSFDRAFKRSTGQSPRDFRRSGGVQL